MENILRKREVGTLALDVSRLLELEISEVENINHLVERLMEFNLYLTIARSNLDPKDWVVTVQANATHGVGRHARLLTALWIAIIIWAEKMK